MKIRLNVWAIWALVFVAGVVVIENWIGLPYDAHRFVKALMTGN